HRQTERFGDGRSRLLRPLQRRAPEVHDVTVSEILGHPFGHLDAQLGEVEVRQPSVEQPSRIVHLSVPHKIHNPPDLTHPAPSSTIPRRSQRRLPRPVAHRRSDLTLYHRAPPTETKLHTREPAGRRPSGASNGRTPRKQRWTAGWRWCNPAQQSRLRARRKR